jgi:hypothetical protein
MHKIKWLIKKLFFCELNFCYALKNWRKKTFFNLLFLLKPWMLGREGKNPNLNWCVCVCVPPWSIWHTQNTQKIFHDKKKQCSPNFCNIIIWFSSRKNYYNPNRFFLFFFACYLRFSIFSFFFLFNLIFEKCNKNKLNEKKKSKKRKAKSNRKYLIVDFLLFCCF